MHFQSSRHKARRSVTRAREKHRQTARLTKAGTSLLPARRAQKSAETIAGRVMQSRFDQPSPFLSRAISNKVILPRLYPRLRELCSVHGKKCCAIARHKVTISICHTSGVSRADVSIAYRLRERTATRSAGIRVLAATIVISRRTSANAGGAAEVIASYTR